MKLLWLLPILVFTAGAADPTVARIESTLFVPDPLPAVAVQSYGQFQPAPGVIAERASYATAYGLRVPAIVYRPEPRPAGKMPGMVVVNGHGGDKYSWYASYAGILYAQAGAVVVTYDPIGEGERNAERKSATRQHDIQVDPPEMARRMGGLMITDTMQAVSLLSARPDVDPKRIAVLAYSMGSFISGLTCAVDTRLNACVLAGGGNIDGPGGYWDASPKKMCQAIPYQSLLFLGDRGAVLYNLHAARGATLVLNGTADNVVKGEHEPFFEDLRKRTIALHGSDHDVFTFQFFEGGGHWPYFLTRTAALWLEKRLDLPLWTPDSIQRMPETHTNQMVVLGEGISPVKHDDLNALPLEQWQRDKEQYIYETWVANAGAQLAK